MENGAGRMELSRMRVENLGSGRDPAHSSAGVDGIVIIRNLEWRRRGRQLCPLEPQAAVHLRAWSPKNSADRVFRSRSELHPNHSRTELRSPV